MTKYKNIEYEKIDGGIRIYHEDRFNLRNIFDNGQCFRWEKIDDGYVGVAYSKTVLVREHEKGIDIINSSEDDLKEIWYGYFDMDRSYTRIINELKGIDKHLDVAIEYGQGLRLLNQERFETTMSFIISANNNIPRIKKSIEAISRRYGISLGVFMGSERYSFPSPEVLAKAQVSDLRTLGVGFRDKYIVKSAGMMLEHPERYMDIDFETSENALKNLKELSGVGEKVAQCALLFSHSRQDMFPVDTWIRKVLEILYGEEVGKYPSAKDFIFDRFGDNAGIAQQFLFHYARENKLGG